ncbi:YjjG family noncanonical pyrimidine nucleotidase [Flavobacterium oreochromis]|uniref:Noncanonical pyrimidine nucleotidase, YjjG family n=1 Tax=Flavobacterium columnare TaxID=996 RepID=A0A246GDT0_9FLAO|nr:YjjG family noncanonical pyrimidine nucleotidase [Flavobacterium oreochromis]OWP79538.1 noncanonical pyrimidine nucleotidase, YjjG family [Flavobacterium oreochromis]POR29390.1 noncanonical pyrimidine nucleotidase, YjjG family [Flavobacterium columnare]QYS86660.1 YjjG family noncanonical pyrimidine nucleotidase [Flavobacterium oreochromis]
MKYDHIQHIFFDLDHTLWDFDLNSQKTFELILEPVFPKLNINDFIKIYNPINQAYWKLYQMDEITHEELRYRRLKDTFERLEMEVSDFLIAKISEDYIVNLPTNNSLIAGCIEVLDYLYPRYNLHIITNGAADVQFKKIKNSGIDHFFYTITNSELASAKKPNKLIYEYALERAGAKKEESIMIGDCIQADVEGALKFGIEAIYYNPNCQPVKENIEQISFLVELKNKF